jgi:hypothetical protein
LIAHLNARGVRWLWWCHIPNGGFRRPAEAAILAGLGARRGAPDLILIHEGNVYALEIKTPNGYATADQLACMLHLEGAGARSRIAYGLDQAIATLEQWGLLRGKAQ